MITGEEEDYVTHRKLQTDSPNQGEVSNGKEDHQLRETRVCGPIMADSLCH